MKFKKIVALSLSLCVAAGLFAGCGKKKSANDENTIHWYMSKASDNISSQETVMAEANKIIEKELGVKLEMHLFDMGAYNEKMNVILNSNEEVDIVFLNSAEKFQTAVKNGSLVELTPEMLEENAPDILAKSEEFMWDIARVGGKVYGVKGQGPLSSIPSIVFKKDLVEKYNFDYKSVTCLADLEPYLKTIKENEPNMYPLLYQTPDKTSTRYTNNSVAALLYDEEKQEFISELDAENIVDKYRLINEYYKKGYIPKDANTRTEYLAECKSGNYAVMCNTGYYTEDGSKTSAAYGFPCVEVSMGATVIAGTSGSMNCISTTSKKPEKALQLLNLVWKDPYLSNTLSYGVEGVDYTIDEKRSAEIGSKSVVPNSGSLQTWGVWHNWIGPIWDQWDSGWNRVESLRQMQEVNRTAPVSSSLGFRFDHEPVKTEFAKVTSVREEYNPVFKTGCMEDFDKYLADARKKLKDAGIEKYINEVNAQFKAWQKENGK